VRHGKCQHLSCGQRDCARSRRIPGQAPTSRRAVIWSARVRRSESFRAQPARKPGKHLSPHLRRVRVTYLGIEDTPEAVLCPERGVCVADGLLEDTDAVSRRARVELAGQGQKRPGRNECEYSFAVKLPEQAAHEIVDAVLAEFAVGDEILVA